VAEQHLNKVVTLLEDGAAVLTSWVANGDHSELQRAADSELDMVFVDMEHVGFDFTLLRTSLQGLLNRRRIAQNGLVPDVVPIVRVPPNASETSEWIIKQALDSGAYGLALPRLETVAEAERIIQAARYPAPRARAGDPGGVRGYDPRVAARYWGVPPDEYLELADVWPVNPDGNLLLVGLVETVRGVENLASILDATSGFGAIYPGIGDLSIDMGLGGQIRHPEVQACVEEVFQLCQSRGVACAGVAASVDEAVTLAESGFRILGLVGPAASASAEVRRQLPVSAT
jgi:4-hydroxy-2-oxoheptanedioate aldolase